MSSSLPVCNCLKITNISDYDIVIRKIYLIELDIYTL